MKRFATTGTMLLSLALALSVPSFAQTPQRSYKGGNQEYAEYSPLFTQKDPAQKAVLAEKFLKDFPNSDYAADVFQMLSAAYNDIQQWPKVMDVADRFEQAPAFKSQFVTDKNKIVVYSNAALAAYNAGNMDKVSGYVSKELAADKDMGNPATAQMLLTLSAEIPTNLPKDDAAKTKALDTAEDLNTKAQTSVNKLVDSGQLPKDQAPAINAGIEETTALIAYYRQQYDKAVESYEAATKVNTRNGIDWYYLGLSYQSQAAAASTKLVAAVKAENDAKAAKADKPQIDDLDSTVVALEDVVKNKQKSAMDALATSANIASPAQQPAQTALTPLWKATHNDSTDGMADFIKSKG